MCHLHIPKPRSMLRSHASRKGMNGRSVSKRVLPLVPYIEELLLVYIPLVIYLPVSVVLEFLDLEFSYCSNGG